MTILQHFYQLDGGYSNNISNGIHFFHEHVLAHTEQTEAIFEFRKKKEKNNKNRYKVRKALHKQMPGLWVQFYFI